MPCDACMIVGLIHCSVSTGSTLGSEISASTCSSSTSTLTVTYSSSSSTASNFSPSASTSCLTCGSSCGSTSTYSPMFYPDIAQSSSTHARDEIRMTRFNDIILSVFYIVVMAVVIALFAF